MTLRNLGAQSIFRQRITINSSNYLENIYKADLTHEFHCQVHKVKDCHKIALKHWLKRKQVCMFLSVRLTERTFDTFSMDK